MALTPDEKNDVLRRIDADPVKIYTEIFGPSWGSGLASMVPEGLHGPMVRYILLGLKPASFLWALLNNRLMETVFMADDANRLRIHDICIFLQNYAPASCHTTPERVEGWVEFGGALASPEQREPA